MRDIICTRREDGTVECTIPQAHKHHSPTGFEYGYGGSGPADLALNILALCIGPPPECDPEPQEPDEINLPTAWEEFGVAWDRWADCDMQRVRCWDGSHVHADADILHQAFKQEFIEPAERNETLTIAGAVIEAWVTAKRAQLREAEAAD